VGGVFGMLASCDIDPIMKIIKTATIHS